LELNIYLMLIFKKLKKKNKLSLKKKNLIEWLIFNKTINHI